MQSAQEIALTPALSPEEREKVSWAAGHSLISDFFQRGRQAVPSPGGEGQGEGGPSSRLNSYGLGSLGRTAPKFLQTQ